MISELHLLHGIEVKRNLIVTSQSRRLLRPLWRKMLLDAGISQALHQSEAKLTLTIRIQPTATIMSLPAELRNRIYELYHKARGLPEIFRLSDSEDALKFYTNASILAVSR